MDTIMSEPAAVGVGVRAAASVLPPDHQTVSQSDSSESSVPSPITHQPITNLALICRYLTPKELLAIDKTCRLLSQAASHPLTFQQETEVGVEDDLGRCRSYARGPSGIFSADITKLRKALTSRLFKHIRILKLGHVNTTPCSVQQIVNMEIQPVITRWLKCLADEAISPRSLTIQTKSSELVHYRILIGGWSGDESVLREWGGSKAMQFLTLLHLVQLDNFLCTILKYLPPNVKILHLTLNDYGRGIEPQIEDICESLGNHHLTEIIFEAVDGAYSFTSHMDIFALAKLSRSPTIKSIHWQFPLDVVQFSKFIHDAELIQLWPNELEMTIPKIRSLMLGFHDAISAPNTFEKLCIFTDLTGLIFIKKPEFISSFKGIQWPQQLRQSLLELRFMCEIQQSLMDCLIAAGLTQIHTLVFDDKIHGTLLNLLELTPNLTSLTVQRLEDVYKPTSKDQIESSALVLIKALPALVELCLLTRMCSTPEYPAPKQCLSHLPNLKRIKWSRQPSWLPIAQMADQFITYEEMRREDERLARAAAVARFEEARREFVERVSTEVPCELEYGDPQKYKTTPAIVATPSTTAATIAPLIPQPQGRTFVRVRRR